MKKNICFIFVTLLFCMAGLQAKAGIDRSKKVEYNNIFYYLDLVNLEAEVAPGYFPTGSVKIPSQFYLTWTNRYSVISIGEDAFRNCSELTSISIPNGVYEIGSNAFQGCISIKAIKTPNTVISIGNSVFSDCSKLETIVLSEKLQLLSTNLFRNCKNLKVVIIGSNVKKLSSSAFVGCESLRDVYLYAKNVPIVDSGELFDDYSKNIILHVPSESVEAYKISDSFKKCKAIVPLIGDDPSTSSEVGTEDFKCGSKIEGYYDALYKTLTISGEGSMWNYTNDDSSPWYGKKSSINKVIVEEGVTYIGNQSFTDMDNLISVLLPQSITSIGKYAFSNCKNLTSINLPINLSVISEGMLQGCSKLQKIELTNNISSIMDGAFWSSGLEYLDIPDNVTYIGGGAFQQCSKLKEIKIGKGLTSIENMCFKGCYSLENLVIPDGVKTIGAWAFQDCFNMTSLVISNSVNTICQSAFRNCAALPKIFIPNGVESIEDGAFAGAVAMTNLIIGSGVRSLGRIAFRYCEKIVDVYCYAESVPSSNVDLFNNSPINNATLHVPENLIESYKSILPWSDFKSIVALKDSDPTPTGINEIEVFDKDFIYNMNGYRIDHPSKGLYIKNGKKYVVK